CRWPNNDTACIHEILLADVAAAVKHLREARGFERVVFFGNSGGGALYTFYQSQAATKPPQRLKTTPAGDPYDLNQMDLPEADGIIQVATHLGEGVLLLHCIDPSVTDESDPLSRDPALDMYDPRNGYRELPEASKYSEEFLARFRAGQRARVARLDEIARGFVADMHAHLKIMMSPEYDGLSLARKNEVNRRALVGRFMVINRTEAHPAYTDPTIYPSKRDIGSFFPRRPDIFNYMEPGFGRIQTPRAWLSTWSGLSSKANTIECLPKVTIPSLVIGFTGDNVVFKPDIQAIHDHSPAADKALHWVDGDHLGLPPECNPKAAGRAGAMKIVTEWLRERFPGA
ncbi:MAG: hypothetical protein KC466_21180, partial [Myxococcales bacterium]|nr:hypothetical protein [Myxococcales bacterium]